VTLAAALTVLLAVLAIGVLRRWRWMFWLVVVAFLAGSLRVVALPLQLAGLAPAPGPAWYTVFQAAVGVIQVAIALVLLRGYRKAGAWGAF
jgi:hypothetical protein